MPNRVGGGTGHISKPAGSSAFDATEQVVRTFRAGGAITQGVAVMLQFDTARAEVVEATGGVNLQYRVVGIYDPELNNYEDAVEGDIVSIVVEGHATALVDGDTNDVDLLETMEPGTGGVLFRNVATGSEGDYRWKFIFAEAASKTTAAAEGTFNTIYINR